MKSNKAFTVPRAERKKLIDKAEFLKLAAKVKKIFEEEEALLAKQKEVSENTSGGKLLSFS